MSLTAEAREAWRLDRLHPRLAREHGTAVARAEERLAWFRFGRAVRVVLEWALPLVLPLLTSTTSGWAMFLALGIVTMPGTHAVKDLQWHVFETLHMPSRRGLVVARWAKRLPNSLWIGACTAGYLGVKLAAVPSCPTPWTSFAAVGLTPPLWALFRTSDTKQESAAMRAACKTAYSTVCALAASTGAALLGRDVFGPQGASGGKAFGLILLSGLALLFWWSVFAGLRDVRRLGLASVSPGRFVCRVGSTVSAAVWFLALCCLTAPAPEKLARFFDHYGDAFGAAGLAITLGAGWFFVHDHLRIAATAERTTFAKPADASAVAGSAEAGPLSRPGRAEPGVGLWRAQWRLFREKHPRGEMGTWVNLVLYALPPAVGATAIVASDYGLLWWFVVGAVLAAPPLVAVGDAHAERLRLFGVDARERTLHNVRALFLVAAAPTLLSAAVTGTVLGWTPGGVLALSALAAAFVCRAGAYGYGGGAPLLWTLATWAMIVGTPYVLHHEGVLSMSSASWFVTAGVAALGLLGIFRRIHATRTDA